MPGDWSLRERVPPLPPPSQDLGHLTLHAVILHPTSPQGHTGEGSQDLLRSWLRSVNILQGSHSLLYMVGLFLEMAA